MSTAAASSPTPADVPEVTESSSEDLAFQRYLLDLALQPIDRFDGFTNVEQYGGSAFRYQLNFICYALAMAQYTRTPAFTGYLKEAQSNTIEKMCDKRVWSYWSRENLVGYQSWNPDPIVFANVMYTGFFGVMLAMYQTLNDDLRFDERGSLTLVWNDRTRYQYDFGTIVEAIVRNMNQSKHTQYPCEPRLIYPMCNAFALNTLPVYDRLHGTDVTADLVGRVRESYKKYDYLRSDGRFVTGRGPLNVAFPAVVANDAIMSYWLHPLMPDISERSWEIVRERFVHIDEESEVKLRGTHFEKIDLGGYMKGDAMTRGAIMCAAKEMGDNEAAAALEASLDSRYEIERSNGARKYKGPSTWANCFVALSKFTRTDGIADLLHGRIPDPWRTGPVLAGAAYPDVLVARAITDGTNLDLVLRPGNGAVDTGIEIERLVPGKPYRVTGASSDRFVAESDGTALIELRLSDRTEVSISPDR